MGRKNRGSVYEVPGGWRAQVTINRKRMSLGVWPTEAKAWAVVEAYLEQVGETAEGHTLLSYGQRWLDQRELDGVVTHVQKDRSRWRHVERAPFATWPLSSIDRQHVAQWVRELSRESDLSRQSVVHVLNLLRGCLRAAADEGLTKSNAALEVRVPRGKPRAPRWTFLTVEEIAKLEQMASEDDAAAAAVVAVYTGLRMSEQRRLRWEDVHLDEDRPRVVVRGTKSQAAVREVPLLPPAQRVLAERRERGGVRRLAGYVWARDDGGVPAASDPWRWRDHRQWRRGTDGKRKLYVREGLRSRAGIRNQVRWHDLRHTCASHLVMGTWGRALDLYEVRAWLGHSEIKVTQAYAHLAPESIHGRARELSRSLDLRAAPTRESHT
ncbi:MAG: tyrosine-type recombinase/integrase [Myxococcota bacterium]